MIKGGNKMKYSNAKKNGRKMKENMFTSGKAQIIFKYFCFILLMLIIHVEQSLCKCTRSFKRNM